MLKIIFLIVYFILQINLINQVESVNWERFQCNQESDVQFGELKRLLNYKGMFYMVFDNLIIRFNPPVLFTSEFKATDNEVKKILIGHEIFIAKGIKEIETDKKYIGTIYDKKKEILTQVFAVPKENSTIKDEARGKDTGGGKFDDTILLLENDLNFTDIPGRLTEKYYSNIPFKRSILEKFITKDLGTFKFHVELGDKISIACIWGLKQQFGVTLFSKTDPYADPAFDNPLNDKYPMGHPEFGLLHYYEGSKDENERLRNFISIIEFHKSPDTILFRIFNEENPTDLHLNSDFSRKLAQSDTEKFEFVNFFNCRIPINKSAQLKGIFFDKNNKNFIIFIRRFYIIKSIDLIFNEFQLDDTDFKNADELEFVVKDDSKKSNNSEIVFEDFTSKWIRINRNNIQKLFLWDTVFNLYFKNSKLIAEQLKLEEDDETIQKCDYQTLIINNNYYCFNESNYFYFEKNSIGFNREIKDIFNSTNVNSTIKDDPKVISIFNYLNDQVIFMTSTYNYILNYTWFQIDGSGFESYLKLKTDQEIKKFKNCIIMTQKCVPIRPLTLSPGTGVQSSSTMAIKDELNSGTKTFLLAGGGGFVFLLLIMIILFKNCGKRTEIKESQPDLKQNSNQSSQISENSATVSTTNSATNSNMPLSKQEINEDNIKT